MNHSIRQAALTALSVCPRAFLRCDRGDALYVTDAPLRADHPERLLSALQAAGFDVRQTGGSLWYLTPTQMLLHDWAESLTIPSDPLHFSAFADRAWEQEDVALALSGIKRMELPLDHAALNRYEKSLRQWAAVCLRAHRGGGALPLCGCLLEGIRKEIER